MKGYIIDINILRNCLKFKEKFFKNLQPFWKKGVYSIEGLFCIA
jgi:hypothetical protein